MDCYADANGHPIEDADAFADALADANAHARLHEHPDVDAHARGHDHCDAVANAHAATHPSDERMGIWRVARWDWLALAPGGFEAARVNNRNRESDSGSGGCQWLTLRWSI